MFSTDPLVQLNAVQRPNFGRAGLKLQVAANYFHVTKFPTADVYQYDISISPEVPRALARRLFDEAVQQHSAQLTHAAMAYDGSKIMYSLKELPFESHVFKVTLPEDTPAPKSAKPRPLRTFTVKVTKTNRVNMYALEEYIQGRLTEYPAEAMAVMFRLYFAYMTSSNGESRHWT
jgi:eukaryotic translation initiation factor 2C